MNEVRVALSAFVTPVAAATTACNLVLTPEPSPTPIGVAPASCGFGPFDPLGFKGETSLAEAGIPGPFGADRDQRGTLYVTEGPKAAVPGESAVHRVFCMRLDDGSQYIGEVPDAWQPPD